eukprot:11220182-Lingulodinium_polyedra.AAC.1
MARGHGVRARINCATLERRITCATSTLHTWRARHANATHMARERCTRARRIHKLFECCATSACVMLGKLNNV